MRVGLICSAGGHLAQLHRLELWWKLHDRFWVTLDKPDSQERLAGERVVFAHGPTNRSLGNLAKNLKLAREVLDQERPDLLVSNGAGIALPFYLMGRMMGIPLIYVEVPDRLQAPSLTGRLVRPLVDAMVLPREEQRAFFPDGVVIRGRF